MSSSSSSSSSSLLVRSSSLLRRSLLVLLLVALASSSRYARPRCDCDDEDESGTAMARRDDTRYALPTCKAKGTLRYRNLVFEGGGMKGVSHVGALKALARLGYYDEMAGRYTFEGLAGTSVGCVFALATALDIPPDRLERYVLEEVDFYSLLNENSTYLLDRFPTLESRSYFSFVDYIRYTYRLLSYTLRLFNIWQQDDVPGIDNGKRFTIWLRSGLLALSPHASAFARLGYDPTLAQLRDVTGHSLSCYAARLVDTDIVRFAVDNAPNARVIDVVYASCSLPMLFKPSYDEEGYPLVDGGLLNNFPIDEYDDDPTNSSSTLGLSLHEAPNAPSSDCVCRAQRRKSRRIDERGPFADERRRRGGGGGNRIVRNIDFMRKLVEAAFQDRDYLRYTRDPRNCDRIAYLASSLHTLELTADKRRLADDIATAERRVRDFLSENSSESARRIGHCVRYAKRQRQRERLRRGDDVDATLP